MRFTDNRMGYKAAVQILRKADDLKDKVLRKCDLLNDSQAWTDQQKLQGIYHQVLVLDLEYALDEKVEQDLWNIGFKNHIGALQEISRDKRNPRRSESQALLTWCLEAASGFYLTLLHEFCNIFDIDLPFRRRGNVYGETSFSNDLNLPQSSSCLYICQYCLVHLGDIARYRNQRKQAENFYKQAILVSPTSGHPYNQLALLEASQGNKLSTVFYYIRGIAVKNPFPAATTNLLNTLSSTIDKENPLEKVQTKITVSEFIQIFLSTHALLHTITDLKQAEIGVKTLNSTMTALVATQSFTFEQLTQVTAINLYALKHVTANCSFDDLTEDEKLVRHYVLELLAGSLSAFLIPVYTLKNDSSLLEFYALPAVKHLTYWIKNEPKVLEDTVFTNRLQIWPSLCKFLNDVQQYLTKINFDKYMNTSLKEDKALQGFKPFSKNFKELNFKEVIDEKMECLIRVKQILNFGCFVSDLDVNNVKLLTKTVEGDKIKFEPGCIQPDPTNDLLEEMKSFNITEAPISSIKKVTEKRGGILKPQGSLEKSREERELLALAEPNVISDSASIGSMCIEGKKEKELAKGKRSKQNVALQSIFKKLEENKQVKFNVEDNAKDKEKLVMFDAKTTPSSSQFNSQMRTQSFNQNHPALSLPPNQPDYLNTLRNVTNPSVNSINNYVFKTDVPPPNTKVPPPPLPQFGLPQSSQSLFNNPNPTNFPSTVPSMQNSYNPSVHQRPIPPYQATQFPTPNHTFNVKAEEPPTWWPNTQNPSTFSRNDNFNMNFPFNNSLPFMQQPDFNKSQPNQAGGDMFNLPWNNFGPRGNFMEPNINIDNSGAQLSMRQTMLKESNTLTSPMNRPGLENFSAPYSLFNANSWTPNLVGQLRNPKGSENLMSHLPQHSLFTGQGPQSLAQLLEQQQSQKNDL